MKVRLHRAEDVPALLVGATLFYRVHDEEAGGVLIGTVAQFGGEGTRFPRLYRVIDAGPGVEVIDPQAVYHSADEAAESLWRMRQTSDALKIDQPGGLTRFERDVLDFEGAWWWRHKANKDEAVRLLFPGISSIRYAQMVNRLLDDPRAEEYAPSTVRRLRSVRNQARAARGR